MSLILCRECGKDVSTTAVTCPHCGAGVKVDSGPGVFGGLMWFFGGLVVVAMLVPLKPIMMRSSAMAEAHALAHFAAKSSNFAQASNLA